MYGLNESLSNQILLKDKVIGRLFIIILIQVISDFSKPVYNLVTFIWYIFINPVNVKSLICLLSRVLYTTI